MPHTEWVIVGLPDPTGTGPPLRSGLRNLQLILSRTRVILYFNETIFVKVSKSQPGVAQVILMPILRYKTANIALAAVAAGRVFRHQAAVGGVDGFQ